MRDIAIARNYADALFALASEAGAVEAWGEMIDAFAAAVSTPAIESVLMSPRVTRAQKIAIVAEAMKGAPSRFVLFVEALIRRGRQLLAGHIADEYRSMVDQQLGRVRAGITTARQLDDSARRDLVARLEKALGKQVIGGFAVDPSIVGGTVVRIGDRIYDGSVRKRLGKLRQELLRN